MKTNLDIVLSKMLPGDLMYWCEWTKEEAESGKEMFHKMTLDAYYENGVSVELPLNKPFFDELYNINLQTILKFNKMILIDNWKPEIKKAIK